MRINKISLKSFRNIENLTLDFDDINIIWGENAQGKTNLIEAIYLFTGGRSFRGTRDRDLIEFDSDSATLDIDFSSNGREQSAQIEIKDRKRVYLNGIYKRSPAEIGEEIKAVVFSPVHMSMIKDGPAERRKFVDMALCQLKANYRNLLKDYSKALVQRNALLKKCEDNPSAQGMLSVWNMNLAKSGAKIIYQRMKYVEAITPFVDEIFSGISAGRERLELKYSGSYQTENIAEIEERLFLDLEAHNKTDIINRTTTKGPHRHDIEIFINGKNARLFASQGQQRSCVLALKLAEASLLKEMTGVEPIALLDDVMSELDEGRQDYILNHIKDWQVFITCCDKEAILRLKQGKAFHIEGGRLLEE